MTTTLKKIMNRSEETAYRELQTLAQQYGYGIHVKIRLADVFPIDGSGIRDMLYSFALRSHLDFLVCHEKHDPLFAVEFDGPSHQDEEQRLRDRKKNALCERFSLPLLRINTRRLVAKYNKASLLKWIISAWELQTAFNEAQAKGQIPPEEDFDPIFLWHSGKTVEEVHPHWIALKPRLRLKELQEQGRIPVRHTCGFTFTDNDGNYRGIEWIDVHGGKVVRRERDAGATLPAVSRRSIWRAHDRPALRQAHEFFGFRRRKRPPLGSVRPSRRAEATVPLCRKPLRSDQGQFLAVAGIG